MTTQSFQNLRDRAAPPAGRSALAAYAAQPRAAPAAAAAAGEPAQMLAAMRNAARWIKSTPPHLRNAAFARIAPMLQGLLSPEQIEMVRRAPKDDRSIDAFIAVLEQRLRALAGGAAHKGVVAPGP